MNVTVTKRFNFEASHNLINYEGQCSNLHGHSYKLEITFARVGSFIDTSGMVIDFNKVSALVKPIVDRYDHSYLNDYFSQPTAENMAVSIFEEVNSKLQLKDVKVVEVRLWETEKCFATVKEG